MSEFLLAHEAQARLAFLFSILAIMAAWEVAAPRRRQEIPRLLRWGNNLGVVVIDTVLVRLTFPLLAVGMAVLTAERGWGLLNVFAVPGWLAFIISLLLLDLAIYLQHVMFHAVPALWRLHRMHHADLEFDVTTGLRFHPIEILLSMALKLSIVVALGPPAIAVLVFEILLNGTSMFNHSNVRLPLGLDRILRLIVVTPDMHRVHHSIYPHETNSNFGFNLPWWDRLLGTYRAQPKEGHEGMTIGIEQFRTSRDLWLDQMLIQPLRGPASGYPINREGKPEMNISRLIDANELQQQITGGAALTILDVRGPDEFVGALGHIPGAVNIPVGDIANRLIEIKALGNKPVIMVCKTDRRSAHAAEILRNENFADVRVLRGGMERWNQIGLQVKGGAPDT
ncbi:MAG: sterol desaturase family protein [Aestuariivirga sp.]|nr:sterol desaturase family protein [Aestuariivirga sp.]